MQKWIILDWEIISLDAPMYWNINSISLFSSTWFFSRIISLFISMPFGFFPFTPDFPDFHFRYMNWFERFSFNFRFLSCTCHARVIHKERSMRAVSNIVGFRVVAMKRPFKWKTLNDKRGSDLKYQGNFSKAISFTFTSASLKIWSINFLCNI